MFIIIPNYYELILKNKLFLKMEGTYPNQTQTETQNIEFRGKPFYRGRGRGRGRGGFNKNVK